MNKKLYTITIVIIITAIVIFAVFYFFLKPSNTPTEQEQRINIPPFGTKVAPVKPVETTAPIDTQPNQEPTIQIPTERIRLRQISSMPIAGAGTLLVERLIENTIINSNISTQTLPAEGKETSVKLPETGAPQAVDKKIIPEKPKTEMALAVRYADMATGNIYQTFVDKIYERRISTTIIPKISEAFFGTSSKIGQSPAEGVILRYASGTMTKTINSFYGEIPKTILGGDSLKTELTTKPLNKNITDLSISVDGKKMFFLIQNQNNTDGFISNLDGSNKIYVFNSYLNEWRSAFVNEKTISLFTKPSYGSDGYFYNIALGSNSFTKILGPIAGLTALESPNGKIVLYGKYEDGKIISNIYEINSRKINQLGLKTLPEKCVWSKNNDDFYCFIPKEMQSGNYPDVWYQGLISFSDEIWKINATTGQMQLLATPTEIIGQEIDSINPFLDSKDEHLFFTNKKDNILWVYDLI